MSDKLSKRKNLFHALFENKHDGFWGDWAACGGVTLILTGAALFTQNYELAVACGVGVPLIGVGTITRAEDSSSPQP